MSLGWLIDAAFGAMKSAPNPSAKGSTATRKKIVLPMIMVGRCCMAGDAMVHSCRGTNLGCIEDVRITSLLSIVTWFSKLAVSSHQRAREWVSGPQSFICSCKSRCQGLV